jgi:hypothetical protein
MAQTPATAYSTIATIAKLQDRRRDPRRHGKGKRSSDVHHPEILGGVVLVRQHVDHECQVDGGVHAEAEPAGPWGDNHVA